VIHSKICQNWSSFTSESAVKNTFLDLASGNEVRKFLSAEEFRLERFRLKLNNSKENELRKRGRNFQQMIGQENERAR
jgi:hypothetical protein